MSRRSTDAGCRTRARTRDGRPRWLRSRRRCCCARCGVARAMTRRPVADRSHRPPLRLLRPPLRKATSVLSLVLPKGSLEKATLELFDAADLAVRRGSERDYRAAVDDPRIERVMFLRPQEIPRYVEQGLF